MPFIDLQKAIILSLFVRIECVIRYQRLEIRECWVKFLKFNVLSHTKSKHTGFCTLIIFKKSVFSIRNILITICVGSVLIFLNGKQVLNGILKVIGIKNIIYIENGTGRAKLAF